MKKPSVSRGRTLAHLHQMLAATAAVGCSRADVQTVTLTPLPTVPASATDGTVSPAPLPPTASAALSSPPPSAPTAIPSGYLVVDMLPAPARCLGLASATKASARFHASASGPVLEIVVTLPSTGNLAGSKWDGTASAWSGQVQSSSFHGPVATVRVKPAAATTSLGVSLGVSCGAAGSGAIAVTATFAGPAAGTSASLTLQDY